MDKRIGEICLLLPANHYSDGLISGFENESAINSFKKKISKLAVVDAGEADRWHKNSSDIILSHLPGRPRTSIIRNVFSSLRIGGTAVFLIRSSISAWLVKTIQDHTAGHGVVREVYGLAPSLNELRLAVPLANKACAAASLALYQPSLLKARIKKYAAYLLGRVGANSLWAPSRLIISQKGCAESLNGFPALIERLFGHSVKLALFTGTPGYLRKTTLQVMDPSGLILGYCKIGDTPQTRDVLKNEAEMLNSVNSISLGNTSTPDVLYSGSSETDEFYLIQSTRKGHLSTGPLTLDERHLDFLMRLIEQTKCVAPFLESACNKEVSDRLFAVRAYTKSEDWHLMKDSLDWTSRILSTGKMLFCFAHRDFTPWNTFVTDGDLYVFDWEFARHQWIPLADAFHFVLQKGIIVDRAPPEQLWDRIMSASSKERRIILKCASAIQASKENYLALLAFYLCDMLTLYFFHFAHDKAIFSNDQRLVDIWRGLLTRIRDKR